MILQGNNENAFYILKIEQVVFPGVRLQMKA